MVTVLIVEILPGKDGMCHIIELADFRVKRVEDIVKMGDMIRVKVLGVDERGKIKLSRKAAMNQRAVPLPRLYRSTQGQTTALRGSKSSGLQTHKMGGSRAAPFCASKTISQKQRFRFILNSAVGG